jgi:hypothetical protein
MASFKTIYKREATEGIARLKPVPDLTEKDIASLPDPVQQYLRYTVHWANHRSKFARSIVREV